MAEFQANQRSAGESMLLYGLTYSPRVSHSRAGKHHAKAASAIVHAAMTHASGLKITAGKTWNG